MSVRLFGHVPFGFDDLPCARHKSQNASEFSVGACSSKAEGQALFRACPKKSQFGMLVGTARRAVLGRRGAASLPFSKSELLGQALVSKAPQLGLRLIFGYPNRAIVM